MKGKLTLAIGAAAGYVLGTRAGRERYEQIKSQANRWWHDPKVQQKAAQAQGLAKDKAPEVQHRVADAATKVSDTARSRSGQGRHVETDTSDAHWINEPPAGGARG